VPLARIFRVPAPAQGGAVRASQLADHISSSNFFAHIRAAIGSSVQQTNCHPFRHDRWLFMHNGYINEFAAIKRDLVLAVIMSTIDEEMVVAHFIVSADVERSRRFYTEVLGGKTVISGESGDEVTYVALANSWIIINVGGGPTDDKPTVTLETPPDPDRVSSFLNIRVADIQAVYAEWSARGADFLTPPKQHETEMRCYIRDPDGYIIEVGQTTLARGWRPPS
jgi:catechol 2,3-dioxygenase-like lactoylglutathione lyase family enzyme